MHDQQLYLLNDYKGFKKGTQVYINKIIMPISFDLNSKKEELIEHYSIIIENTEERTTLNFLSKNVGTLDVLRSNKIDGLSL